MGTNGCENGEHDVDRPSPNPVTPSLRTLALPAALVATLALTSCGSSASPSASPSPSPSATPTGIGTPARLPVNAADVSFATMMILQHTQGIAMVDLALKRAADAKVKALAPKIKAGEVPELARMSGWFTSVNSPVPSGVHDMSMPGMEGKPQGVMSAKDMTDLGTATGSGFDRMWLRLMIRHHQGAVAMARTELTKGSSPDVKQVAQAIVDRQSAEIATMTSILTGLPQP
jgi:uncharacterized protein (DUF305 family)